MFLLYLCIHIFYLAHITNVSLVDDVFEALILAYSMCLTKQEWMHLSYLLKVKRKIFL